MFGTMGGAQSRLYTASTEVILSGVRMFLGFHSLSRCLGSLASEASTAPPALGPLPGPMEGLVLGGPMVF